jgi:hypothetical protein
MILYLKDPNISTGGWVQWLIPVILPFWEMENERLVVPGQTKQNVCKSLLSTNKS